MYYIQKITVPLHYQITTPKGITNKIMKNAAILHASILGTEAFNSGKKCVAWHDLRLVSALEQNQDLILKMLKAWNKAWTAANLSK